MFWKGAGVGRSWVPVLVLGWPWGDPGGAGEEGWVSFARQGLSPAVGSREEQGFAFRGSQRIYLPLPSFHTLPPS